MADVYTVRRPPRRRGKGPLILWLVFLLAAAATAGVLYYEQYVPSKETIVPDYGSDHPVIFRGEVLKGGGVLLDGDEVKLPLDAVEQALAPETPVRYEAESGSIILTTADKVMRLKTNALTATVNRKPFELQVAAEEKDGTVYIPLTPLRELYGLQAEAEETSGIVTLLSPGTPIQRGEVGADGAAIRTEPSIHAPIAEQAPAGGIVRIWGERSGWYAVQGDQGYTGYTRKSEVKLSEMEVVPAPKAEPPFVAWKVLGTPINMTWEAVYSSNPDTSKIGDLPGVNVVSPTWMELTDDTGTIKIKADPNFVAWAHNRKMQVWGLFGNSFEPERTSAALATYETRFKMIQQLLSYSAMYKLQGINLDFENVYVKDKANLVQFVREFTPLAHEQGLVVSIDVTPKSTSEVWSLFLDRGALAATVDYMMLMAYDEYWATSPTAGSVSSLPWTETSISRILKEDGVPPEKLILGMPLYTRIWTEKTGADGKVKVSSKAIGMEKADEIVKTKKLTPVQDADTGQHYVEYQEDGALNRIWLEDEWSVQSRIALVKKYGLAGVATWQRAFQKPAIWNTIHESLSHYP